MTTELDETHDPSRRCWVEGADSHPDFPIQNLPLGIFSTAGRAARGGIAIADHVLDLAALAAANLLTGDAQIAAEAASGDILNPLLTLGSGARSELRKQVSRLLSDPAQRGVVAPLLAERSACIMQVPARVGDYTDFYVGIHHATNVGRLFRPDTPLLPNYKYVPIGYHGRASSIRPSGTPVHRPSGQLPGIDGSGPKLAATRRLDYELELGVWIGAGSELGVPIPIAEAPRHVAGLCLLNDWSARDIQAWEYQPLGPFLAKNFLTTVSPWIVTAEALAPFRIAQPPRPTGDPEPVDYLFDKADQSGGAFAITLEVAIASAAMRKAGMPPLRLSRGPASNMYWTIAQMIAHHTVNGCDLNPGDLLGTGTISSPDATGLGSLLELSRGGTAPMTLPTGETRTFLEDGDELSLTGRLEAEGHVSIGFGPCSGIVFPARAG